MNTCTLSWLCYRRPFVVVISPHNKIRNFSWFHMFILLRGISENHSTTFFHHSLQGDRKKCWTCQFWEWQWRLRDSDSSAMFKRHFTYHTTWPQTRPYILYEIIKHNFTLKFNPPTNTKCSTNHLIITSWIQFLKINNFVSLQLKLNQIKIISQNKTPINNI